MAPGVSPGEPERRGLDPERSLREAAVGALIVGHRQAELLQVVGALGAPGRFAGRLDGWQEQRDEHGDDGDHHQQLDQRERFHGFSSKVCVGQHRGSP